MSDYKQTRDAAGRVTSTFGKMLEDLEDDKLTSAKEYFKDWFYEDMYGDNPPDKPVVDFDDTFSAFQQAMEDKLQAAYIAGYEKALSKFYATGGYVSGIKEK